MSVNSEFAHFEMSFEHARRSEYEIIGTKGGIKCHTVWQPETEEATISWWNDEEEQTVSIPKANHFNLEIEHFSECILQNKAPKLTMTDARNNCAAICAALASVRQSKKVDID